MKMRKVWRLENSKGQGVYTSYAGRAGVDLCGAGCTSGRHPLPHDDVGLRDGWKKLPVHTQACMYFGFASLAQYRAWFFKRAARKALADGGIVLRQFVVPEDAFLRGMNQAVFLRAEANMIQERSPDI